MKTYPHLFNKLFCQALMLREMERRTFEQHLLQHMGMSGSAAPVVIMTEPAKPQALDRSQMSWRQRRVFEQFGDVAVIHIDGVIDKRVSSFDLDCYGGVDLADVDAALSMVAADRGISRVVLDINSPGGSVVGVHETYTRISALAQEKEVHAYVNCLCCSAGYYIASAADVIAAAPSAIVGSIGVYIAMLDASRWAEIEGLSMQMIKAGKWKDMGSPWRPLTDEEKAKLQKSVDDMHTQFKAAVTANRDISPEAMEGQWMSAEEALGYGIVDDTTGATLDEYVTALLLG
jgi:protease-4